MKILMVSNYFLPHRGGVENHILGLSRELKSRGHEITLLTPKYDRGLPVKEDVEGIKVVRFTKPRIPKLGQIMLYRWLKSHRNLLGEVDLIHGHDLYLKPLTWLYRSTSYFVTFHGYEGYPLRKRDIEIRRFVARRVGGSIAVGDFQSRWYGFKPTLVTYGAVELKSLPKTNKDLEAVFVGRLEPDTGALTYARALRDLSKGQPLTVAFVGSGSLQKEIAEILTSTGVKLEMPGTVEDVRTYLNRSRVALVSGYLSILEAMSLKVPVVALYENPLKKDYLEMMPESGKIMAIAADSADVASKIRSAWENTAEAKRQVELGYRWAQDQSWSRLADVYEKLWGLR